jgi:hypothetical protein
MIFLLPILTEHHPKYHETDKFLANIQNLKGSKQTTTKHYVSVRQAEKMLNAVLLRHLAVKLMLLFTSQLSNDKLIHSYPTVIVPAELLQYM